MSLSHNIQIVSYFIFDMLLYLFVEYGKTFEYRLISWANQDNEHINYLKYLLFIWVPIFKLLSSQ